MQEIGRRLEVEGVADRVQRARILRSRLARALVFVALSGMLGVLLWTNEVVRPLRAAPAGADLPDAPPVADAPAKDEPGLMLTFTSLAQGGAPAGGLADVRAVRLLALYVPQGSPPSPFTPAGPFRATFEGDINMRLRDFLSFSAEGRGKLSLKVNGKPVLDVSGDDLSQKSSESVRLNKGKNHIVAVYESPAAGDAALRIFWATKTTSPEPLPPAILSHNAADKALGESLRVRDGRLLLAQLRCTKCHATPGLVGAGDKEAMPELQMDAPSLGDAGARLNGDWMAAWINNPRALRAGAHMPRLFGGDDKAIAAEARDVAAYLAALGAADAGAAPDAKNVEAGGRLFAHLNCVACHISPERTGEAQEGADVGRISLAYVKAKFKPATLKAFLLKPAAHYAWISMPDFRLSDVEADSLAAYLLSLEGTPIAAGTPGNAANGAKLIRSAGCINCHALSDKQPATDTPKLSPALSEIPKPGWAQGCLAADGAARKNAPDFALSAEQREAILAFAATDRTSLKRDSAAEFADRQMASLRCVACHARDGRESLLATVLDAEDLELKGKHPSDEKPGTEGIAPDQRAPLLTWAGEKLRPEWTAEFIGGKLPYKPRYYLRARMPAFTVRADGLARGLAMEHGCPPTYPPYGPPDKDLAAVGQKLVGKTPNESFSCVQCHAIANQPALAPFEAPSINFMYVTSRLRKDYYFRWMHNPIGIDPETKMPRFDDADGKTGVPAFDNDAKKQFNAIWNYLLMGKDITPPVQ
ncbi:MAG: Cytochrome c class [Phycisphaerales bacterium]|nr:Cytochrome c class [Phycisphaerales bacterium]